MVTTRIKKISAFLLVISLSFGFGIIGAIPSHAEPDYTSTYLPELKAFNAKVSTVIRKETAFGKDFSFESKEFLFDLTVRVHRNTLSGVNIMLQGPPKPTGSLAAPCETFAGDIFSGSLKYGSTYSSASAWPQLDGLQSRVADGDFFIEKYQFKGFMEYAWASNRSEGMGYCEGNYKLARIDLWDMAKRSISIYLPGSSAAQVFCKDSVNSCENGFQLADFWKSNNLSTNPCPILRSSDYESAAWYQNCFKGDWKSLDYTISKTNTPSTGKLEVFDYKALYQEALKAKDENSIKVTSLTADKTALQGQLTSLTADNTSLQNQVTSLTKEKSSLQSQVTTLTSDKTSLQGQVASLGTDKTSIQNQVTSLTKEKTSLQSQVTTLTSDKTSLQGQITDLNTKLSLSQKSGTSLSAKLKKICSAKPKPKGC